MGISRANVAAQIMEHLCNCAEHGYSQPGRYGASGYCTVQTDAGPIKVKKGDRDCSSAVCEAWELALVSTGYEGRITRYNWTGSMREAFLSSGLFTWENMSFNASRGDVYLDEQNHTAMCIQNDGAADLLGGFSISETGGIDGSGAGFHPLAYRTFLFEGVGFGRARGEVASEVGHFVFLHQVDPLAVCLHSLSPSSIVILTCCGIGLLWQSRTPSRSIPVASLRLGTT